MEFRTIRIAVIAIVSTTLAVGSAARGADDIVDLHEAVKRIRGGLAEIMRDLPADSTTAARNEARTRRAKELRDQANGWKIRAEFTVEDVVSISSDHSNVVVKAEEIGQGAKSVTSIGAKIPAELGRSIHKGDRIRMAGPAVFRIEQVDGFQAWGIPDASYGGQQIAFSAEPRTSGWPRWTLLVSDPAIEVVQKDGSVKSSAESKLGPAKHDALTQGPSPNAANPKRRDAIEVAREITAALNDAHTKGETTVAKKSAVQDAERKLVADVAALESVTLTVRVTDVSSTKPAGDKIRCVIAVDRHSELRSGAAYGERYTAALSAADAAIATAGPCTIKLTGKPALYVHLLAPHKKGNSDRPHGTVVLRSSFGSQDKWELVLTDESDSVEKADKAEK